MAVTRTHPIKSTLKSAIDYILNPEKTDEKLLASSFGCGLETAEIEFAWTREAAGDRGTHLGRHLIQSFAVGETTPEQVKALMQRVEGTVWEMPVILGGLYGMRRSEILGLRWRNVDLENNTFDVSEQLPFKVPPKTKVIEEMAPPKSNGRKLPITELARPFFLKQFAMQEAQREQAEKDGKPYYDNDLVVAKPDGSPISASWVSSQFGKLLEDLDMPHIRFHDLRHPYVKHTTKILACA